MAIGIALLRYRLWDLDLVLKKTLVAVALESRVRDIHAYDPLERSVPQHGLEKAAVAAPKVEHPVGCGGQKLRSPL